MAEAGATPAQEIAFTLANAKEYVRAAIAAGLDVDDFAPRLSFFFVARTTLLEEVAKFRAARRIWAHDHAGRVRRHENPKSQMLRFHTQTAGVQLTAQQPEVNLVRVAVQALAAVLGGTQSLHTNSYDEAIALPTEKAARLALRTQQVIAYETDITKTVDPFAGSYAIESMTGELEAAALELIAGGGGPGRRGCRDRAGLPEDRDRRRRLPDRPGRSTAGRGPSSGSTSSSPARTSPTSRCGSTRGSRRTSASGSRCCAPSATTAPSPARSTTCAEPQLAPTTCCRRCATRSLLRATGGEIAHALRDVWGVYRPRDAL